MMSQIEWEDLYIGPEYRLELRYAQVLSTIFCTLMYGSSMPFLYVFCTAMLCLTY